MAQRPKRPRDTNQLAKHIVELATGEVEDEAPVESDMAKLGRSGGLKGGRARAEKLSTELKREIARKAAEARWKK